MCVSDIDIGSPFHGQNYRRISAFSIMIFPFSFFFVCLPIILLVFAACLNVKSQDSNVIRSFFHLKPSVNVGSSSV